MSRHVWTAEEIELLEFCYEDTSASELAWLLDMPIWKIYSKAKRMGLQKDADWLRKNSGFQPGSKIGASVRFPKGHVPANKGLRRPGYAPGRMAETQFKPGRRDRMPIGARRVDSEGYLCRRVADSGYGGTDWRFEHVLLWQEAHGLVPAGCAIAFKDGNRKNVVLGNLEMITRRELMKRNSVHNLPAELVEVIQLHGALNRMLRRRNREKQDVGPEKSSVRDARSVEGQR